MIHVRALTVAAVLAALAPAFGQKLADPSARPPIDITLIQQVVGRPFSATEERHSLQILSDGTRIETRQTNRLYRDNDGRTRIEETSGNVTLLDPVTRISALLDPSGARILKKEKLPPTLAIQLAADLKKADLLASKTGWRTEVLAPQMLGSVLANGTRTTTTIPTGAVGNDRPINILIERWYSDDLQILVKSTNSDPRFGDTTYEVTGIIQGPPDPALFQLPASTADATDPRVLQKLEMVQKFKALDEAKRKAAEEMKKPRPQ
jgi:hypothetical protein